MKELNPEQLRDLILIILGRKFSPHLGPWPSDSQLSVFIATLPDPFANLLPN